MRRFLDKWGTAIAAVACALTIVFAAVYTRQDDLKRIAAQEARAAQDQSLPGCAGGDGLGAPCAQRSKRGLSRRVP